MYLIVDKFSKLLQVCTSMYWCCTQYVLSIYKYVLGKAKKWMSITLGFEQWISCITSCALYCYAMRVHSMVISLVNSRYIISKIYTGITRYLLAGVRRPARVPQRPWLLPWRHWTWLQLEFPGYPFWLSKRRTLKAQVGCETLLASGVQAGTDCRPWVTPSLPG
jgi:hypothetical protein